jgi:hypothetical protein
MGKQSCHDRLVGKDFYTWAFQHRDRSPLLAGFGDNLVDIL